MATHSSILAWRIPWTEEPGGPQSVKSQRIRHNCGGRAGTAHTHQLRVWRGMGDVAQAHMK